MSDITSLDMSIWLSQIGLLAIKGALVLGVTWILAYSLRKSSASVRYLVWCAGLMSLMFIPLFSTFLPSWELSILPDRSELHSTPSPVPVAPEISDFGERPASEFEVAPVPDRTFDVAQGGVSSWIPSMHWTLWLFGAWVVGMAIVLGRLAVAHIGAFMLIRNAELVHDDDWHLLAESIQERMGIQQVVRLRFSSWTTVPISVGIWRPLVILPKSAQEWDEDQRRTVLVHELAHVKRRDCLLHLLTQITCALHWFNPLVWVAAWRLRIERERACDDQVLRYGIDASHYAETLLDTARSLRMAEWSTVAAVSMARKSQLEGRLLSILDPVRHRHLNKAGTILTLLVIGSIAVPLALLEPVSAQYAPQSVAKAPLVPRPAPALAIGPDGAVDIDPFIAPDVVVPDIEVDIPPINIPSITIPEFNIAIPEIHVPAIEFDAPGIQLEFNGGDPALSVVSIDSLTVEQLIALRKYGIDADFIRGLRRIGYEDITYGELAALGKYGADADYIQAMRQSGYTGFSLKDYARMSKYGVDDDFVKSMAEAGFLDLSAEDLISMSKYGVDDDLIKSLGRYGYGNLDMDDLIAASKYGVDEDLIDGLRKVGYNNLSIRELIAMSKYGVDEDLVVSLAKYGYTDLSGEELVVASKYGVDEDLIESLGAAGFSNVSLEDLVSMSKYGVDEDLVYALGRYGYADLRPSEIIAASKYGVDEDLVIALRDNGYTDITIDEVIAMSKYGVDEDFIDDMRDVGLEFGVEDLIRLRKYGVDGDYIEEMMDAGIEDLSIEQLIEMRKHGVDADYVRELKQNRD